MKSQVEQDAIAYATRFLEVRGYKVDNVTRNRRHKGYDLLALRTHEELKIEVKGCTRPWGIPDLFFTEFDAERRLIADYLYVVYFLDGMAPQLCVIPRDAIDPSMVTPKQGWRIRSTFKKEAVMAKFMVALDVQADDPTEAEARENSVLRDE